MIQAPSMGHRRVLNEGEGPAALPDAPRNRGSPLRQRRESPNWGHLALHLKKVHEVCRRHADEFRFGAPDGRAEHMDAGSIPASHRCRPCFLHDNMPGNGQTLVKLSSGAPWCMAPVGWLEGERPKAEPP